MFFLTFSSKVGLIFSLISLVSSFIIIPLVSIISVTLLKNNDNIESMNLWFRIYLILEIIIFLFTIVYAVI